MRVLHGKARSSAAVNGSNFRFFLGGSLDAVTSTYNNTGPVIPAIIPGRTCTSSD